LVKFLSRYEMDAIVISEALAYIEDNKVDPDTAAVEFLRLHQDDWQRWVPKDVAKRVLAKL
jgi:glycine betaine/proline transport system substrate-binding protein